MNLEKIKPWNWFKHEDVHPHTSAQVPVARQDTKPSPMPAGANSLMRLHREVDRLFDDTFSAFGFPSLRMSSPGRDWLRESFQESDYRPLIDVSGNDNGYEVTLDVPGMSESDLAIEVNGDVLTISGQKEESNESKDRQYYRMERSYGAFQRTLALPDDADSSDIRARLHDGVLTLDIPRRAIDPAKVKRISISS